MYTPWGHVKDQCSFCESKPIGTGEMNGHMVLVCETHDKPVNQWPEADRGMVDY